MLGTKAPTGSLTTSSWTTCLVARLVARRSEGVEVGSKFQAKGPYVAFGISRHCIGGFDTLAEAKRACAHEETAPIGGWKGVVDSFGHAYYAGNGCEIFVGYQHPHVKLTPEEIETATKRYHWRESMR